MAVASFGSLGLSVGWNTDLDNNADRLMALKSEHGAPEEWETNIGSVSSRKVGFEAVELEVSLMDPPGADDGERTLTGTAGYPFGSKRVPQAGSPFTFVWLVGRRGQR